MITLLTGLPGNGKTLFALWFVKKYAEAEGREVFYAGIKDLMLPWTAIDPEKWMDCPAGSIIVLDECQTVFPKKPNGSRMPEHYEKLATHRHQGFDIFLITQHPSLVDNFARQLVGRHYHSVRKFGLSRSTIYEWSAANATPQSSSSQKSAIPMKWAYPVEVYSYYKSAEVHTVKRSIPAKLVLAVLFVVAVFVVGYLVLDSYQGRGKRLAEDARSSSTSGANSGVFAGGAAVVDPMADARRFAWESTPRVVGLQHTAPKYDGLTKPDRVPVPALCIATKSRCKCFSQQGTPLNIETDMCRSFAEDGFFREFDPDGSSSEQLPVAPAAAPAALSSGPSSGYHVASVSPVLVMPHVQDVPSAAPVPLSIETPGVPKRVALKYRGGAQ